jgi:hypothetical protein
MSRFYASIRGGRGEATRTGGKRITGHIRGWHVGVEVQCEVGEDGEDVCNVYRTGGSNKSGMGELIAEVRQNKVRFVKSGKGR